jgi:hypothetical protein
MSKKDWSRHHRLPRSQGGTGHARNISIVCPQKHAAYHRLFQNYLPPQVAAILNEVWIDLDWELVAVRRKHHV